MAKFISAYGYQGDAMNLPVADVEEALPFYLEKMGFRVIERMNKPVRKAVMERDGVQFAISDNGRDPEQDGCAFHVEGVHELRAEFIANGLDKIGKVDVESRNDGTKFNVFYVVAPEGLCYWFGERITE